MRDPCGRALKRVAILKEEVDAPQITYRDAGGGTCCLDLRVGVVVGEGDAFGAEGELGDFD